MKTIGVPALAAASLLLATTCATVTPESQKVRTTQNPQATAGCKFLGNVDVTNTWGPGDSEKKLRFEAAKMGADVLYIGPRMFTKFVTAHGEAYFCGQASNPGPTPSPTPTPN